MGERVGQRQEDYYSYVPNTYTFDQREYFPADIEIKWKKEDFTTFSSVAEARQWHYWLAKLRVAIEEWKTKTKQAIRESGIKDARRVEGLEEKRSAMQEMYVYVEQLQQQTNEWLWNHDLEYRKRSTASVATGPRKKT